MKRLKIKFVNFSINSYSFSDSSGATFVLDIWF